MTTSDPGETSLSQKGTLENLRGKEPSDENSTSSKKKSRSESEMKRVNGQL